MDRGAGNQAPGTSNDVEAKEELAKEEKGKGNRAFQDKRFEDAIKHFSVCIKLDEVRVCVFSSPYCLIFFSNIKMLTSFVPFLGSDAEFKGIKCSGCW